MKNYRVGYATGGAVQKIRKGVRRLGEAAKKPGLKDLEKLKKGRKAPKVKPDPYRRGWEKLPQLKKSQTERREELRKKARKSGGHSKIVFADEWDKIDPGLQKGLFKKEGGRIGLKKGGPKPGTYDYFLLHKKREKKAFGGPSHSVRRAVKKILKKAKAKKDTESVRDVRAEGGRSTKISKRGPVYNKNTGRKIIR